MCTYATFVMSWWLSIDTYDVFPIPYYPITVLKEDNQFIDVVKRTPSSVIIAIICFCSVWSVIGLAGFHTYLTTSDQTTNEDVGILETNVDAYHAHFPLCNANIIPLQRHPHYR